MGQHADAEKYQDDTKDQKGLQTPYFLGFTYIAEDGCGSGDQYQHSDDPAGQYGEGAGLKQQCQTDQDADNSRNKGVCFKSVK